MKKFISSILLYAFAQTLCIPAGHASIPSTSSYDTFIEKSHKKHEGHSKKSGKGNKKYKLNRAYTTIQTVRGPQGKRGKHGSHGSRGSRGHSGHRGKRGKIGTTGAVGATGAEVLDTFASVYQPSDLALTIGAMGNVIFSQNPVAVGGISYNTASGVFTVTKAGYYEVTYGTSATNVAALTFSLGLRYQPVTGPVVNPVPGSTLSTVLGVAQVGLAEMNSISFIFHVAQNELPATFSVFNNSLVSISLPSLGTPGVLAYATVKRIGAP